MSFEEYTNDKEPTRIEIEIFSGKTFVPSPNYSCHDAPKPFIPPLPEWEWTLEHYNEIINKVSRLKDMPELWTQYNDIVKDGRERVHQFELGISSLDEKGGINNKWFEEGSYLLAQVADGIRLDLPELQSPNLFWLEQGKLTSHGSAGLMILAQGKRKIWLEVYEKLASLYYDTQVNASALNPVNKSKRGPRNFSRAEKMAAYQEWQSLDRDINPITLEEWLECKFGCALDGTLQVKPSTFYGWKKLVETS